MWNRKNIKGFLFSCEMIISLLFCRPNVCAVAAETVRLRGMLNYKKQKLFSSQKKEISRLSFPK